MPTSRRKRHRAPDGEATTVGSLTLWVLAALTAATAAAAWLQLDFLNGPQGWQWPYRDAGLETLPAASALAVVVIASVVAARPRRYTGALIALLAIVFSVTLLAAQQGGHERVIRSTVSPSSFSYLYDAALVPSAGELLADYPRHLQGLSLHSRTHPPGPLLLVRAVDAVVDAVAPPEPTAPLAVAGQRAMEREVHRARVRRRPFPDHLLHPWTPGALSLLLIVASGLAAWPIHALARNWLPSAEAASLAALAWLLVPARTLFTPSLDQALPCLLAVALLLAARGAWRGIRGALPAALAGFTLAVCCLTSFGYLAAVPLVACAGLQPRAPGDGALRGVLTRMRADAAAWVFPLAGLGAGLVASVAAFSALTGFDLATTFETALATHHEMAVASRSYAVWLRWNPWDFALLLGPALLALAAAALVRRGRLEVVAPGYWLLLAALWLSGNVRGEVGRIWLMFMPLACILAASVWPGGREDKPLRRPASVALLVAQAALLFSLAANLVFVS